jgi:hypothetical protein
VVQAGRLPNPGFSFGRTTRGDEVEIERGLHVNLARLLAMPFIGPMEDRRFQQTQGLVALSVLGLAADTRKAYVMALAAEESVRYMQQVRQAAKPVRNWRGAWSRWATSTSCSGPASRLSRPTRPSIWPAPSRPSAPPRAADPAVGPVGCPGAFRLPERLPDLPKDALDLPDVERTAMASGSTCRAPAWPPSRPPGTLA